MLHAVLAGETRLEHATGGFGDRCSTNLATPLSVLIILKQTTQVY